MKAYKKYAVKMSALYRSTLPKRQIIQHPLFRNQPPGLKFGSNTAMHYDRPYVSNHVTSSKGGLDYYGAGGGKTKRSKMVVDKLPRNGWITTTSPLRQPF